MLRFLGGLIAVVGLFGQNPNTAKFPTAVATDQDLLVAKDSASSTLTSGINNSTLTIPVANGAKFYEYQVLTIDTEKVLICDITGNTLTVCTGCRGFDGSTAALHDSGAAVYGYINAYYHNQAAAEIKAIETALGANLENIGAVGNALTQATEFTVQGALVKAAAASGRAVEQSTCWRINPSTLALENTCAGAFSIVGQWQTGTLAEPAAGYTALGFKVSTGVPVYRLPSGAETELGGGGSSLPSQTGNAGAVLTTNGTDPSWAHGIDKTKWIAQMRDHFVSASTGAGLGWNSGGTTGAGTEYADHTFLHPGIVGRYTVAADAEKHAFIRLETSTADLKGSVGAIGSNGKWDVYFTFRTDSYQTAQLAYRIGFIATAQVGASPPTDGIWLRYHNSSACSVGSNVTDSYWTYETRASSTSSTSATAVAYSTAQWITVRIRSLVAGTIKFSISTDHGATFSSETDISTNIPTGATLTPTFQVWGCAADTYFKVFADEFTYEAWR